MASKKRIIFVCTGNTCRSPMAQVILRSMLKKRGIADISVSSCGIAPEVGAPIQADAVETLAKLGLKARACKAKPWRDSYARGDTLVLTMTAEMKRFLPFDNVFTLGELTDGRDVADPYGRGSAAYAACAEQLVDMLTLFCGRVLE